MRTKSTDGAGRYAWVLTVVAGLLLLLPAQSEAEIGYGISPRFSLDTTDQPQPDLIEIGELTIAAPDISQTGPGYYVVNGSASINDFLLFSGTMTVDVPNLLISGSGRFYAQNLPDTEVTPGGRADIFDGDFSLDVEQAVLDGFNEAGSLLAMAGFRVTVEKMQFLQGGTEGTGVVMSGSIGLPLDFGMVRVTQLELTVEHGLTLVGRIDVPGPIGFRGGVELRSLFFSFDTVENKFCGGGQVRVPVLHVSGEACLLDGCFDSFYIDIELQHGGVPLGSTGLFLAGGSAGLANLCSEAPVEIRAGVDVTVGPAQDDFTLVRFDNMELRIQPPVHFEGSGGVKIFEQDLASGSIAWSSGSLSLAGRLALLGFIRGELEATLNRTSVYGRARVVVGLTRDSFPGNLRWLARVVSTFVGLPYDVAEVEAILQNTDLRGQVLMRFAWKDYSFAFRIRYENSELHLTMADDYAGLDAKGLWFAKTAAGFDGSTTLENGQLLYRTSLAETTPTLVMILEGSESAPSFNLRSPSGRLVTPGDMEAGPGQPAVFGLNEDEQIGIWIVSNPEQGEWMIEIPDPGDQVYHLNRYAQLPSTNIIVMEPAQRNQTDGTIRWQSEDPNSGARIGLFYDRDDSGFDGVLISDGMPAGSGDGQYTWTPDSDLPSGEYFIYAVIEDDFGAPRYAYAPGSIRVSNQPILPAPSGLQGSAVDTKIILEWDPIHDPDLHGYTIRYGTAPGPLDRRQASLDDPEFEFDYLTPGRQYLFTVAGYDTLGVEGAYSDTIAVDFHIPGQNNAPSFTSTPVLAALAGSPYEYAATASDPDPGDVLTFSLSDSFPVPAGMAVNPSSGLVSWDVPADSLGLFRIDLRVHDQGGLSDRQEFVLRVRNIEASTGLVSLDRATYTGVESRAILTVADPDLNTSDSIRETAVVEVTSTTNTEVVQITCQETSASSGVFVGSFGFVEGSAGPGEIAVADGDTVYVSYTDEFPQGIRSTQAVWYSDEAPDRVPPTFTIVLVQGTVLRDRLNVYVVASEPLQGPPDVTACGSSLTVQTVSDGDRPVYFGSLRLDSSEICAIEVEGTDLAGNVGNALRQFSSSSITHLAGRVSSPDGQFHLSWPEETVAGRVLVQGVTGSDDYSGKSMSLQSRAGWDHVVPARPVVTGLRKSVAAASLPYSVDTGSDGAARMVTVELRCAIRPERIGSGLTPVICLYRDGEWIPLATRFDRQRGMLEATTDHVGTFQAFLLPSGMSPDLPPAGSDLLVVQPSPFQDRTQISFVLDAAKAVELTVYDVTGRAVRVLNAGALEAGDHLFHWDGRDSAGHRVVSGLYFVRLHHGTGVSTSRVILLR